MNTTVAMPSPSIGRDRSDETTPAGVPWLAFARHRAAVRRRWPHPWSLDIATDPLAPAVRLGVTPETVLDVGATTREWAPLVSRRWPAAAYRSLDIDRTEPHDYHTFDALDRRFDLVLCLEVLEHVDATTGLALLRDCVEACRPGGHLLVSVPNVLTPGAQLEITHRSAYSLFDLGGALTWCGLEPRNASRLFLGSRRRRLLHRYLLGALHRGLKVDFCQSIVMLARKPMS